MVKGAVLGDESAAPPHTVRLPCAVDNPRRRDPPEEAQQMEYIAFDAHKHYTLASVAGPNGPAGARGSDRA
jgi:hypothetical protein